MGLKSGEYGAKSWLKKKHAHEFRIFRTLAETRDGLRFPVPTQEDPDATRPCAREETAVFVDGNVLMMAIPDTVTTLDAWADVLFGYIRREAMAAGKLVVVVFDEPESITYAKKEEQVRRDINNKAKQITCSNDIAPPPLPDNFTRAQLEAVPNVSLLKTDRRYKARIYDEVIKRVYERLLPLMSKWEDNGHDAGVLILDGVEVRGCELPPGEKRAPVILGSDPAAAAAFARHKPIGEGDIKLMALENRLREMTTVDERYKDYRLALTWTVDTDSFMTFLLDVAKRRVTPYSAGLHSLFCMREAAKRDLLGNGRATFLVCDTKQLEYKLQCHIWSEAAEKPNAEQMLQAMLALCAAAAVCGCDFTSERGQPGARFDHFWEALPEFVAEEPRALATFQSTLADEPAVARQACQGLLRVCYKASKCMESKPMGDASKSKRTYKKQAGELWDVPECMLRKAVWAAAYWSQNEFEADSEWGFQPNLSQQATSHS